MTNTPPEPPQALLAHSLGAGNGNPAETADPPPSAIRHGACGQWWTGGGRSHCGACHITLSSLSAFEAHRKGLRCNDPGSVGLIPRMFVPTSVGTSVPSSLGSDARSTCGPVVG